MGESRLRFSNKLLNKVEQNPPPHIKLIEHIVIINKWDFCRYRFLKISLRYYVYHDSPIDYFSFAYK